MFFIIRKTVLLKQFFHFQEQGSVLLYTKKGTRMKYLNSLSNWTVITIDRDNTNSKKKITTKEDAFKKVIIIE